MVQNDDCHDVVGRGRREHVSAVLGNARGHCGYPDRIRDPQ